MLLNCSIFECFKECNLKPENVKLEYYGRRFTVKETMESILKVGGFLVENGLKGDSVAIMLPNIPEAFFTLYACSATGNVANLINPKIPTAHLKKILENTSSKMIFLYDGLYERHKEMLNAIGIKVVLCSPLYYRKPLRFIYEIISSRNKKLYFEYALKSRECQPVIQNGQEAVAYIHSGGTTGEPKTVVLSSFALNNLANAILTSVHPDGNYDAEKDAMLMMLPIFHGFGLGVCVHTIACACRVVLEPRFLPKESVRLIKKHNVTHLAGVPAMFRKMLEVKNIGDGRLKNVTNVFCGGDSLSVSIKEKFDLVLKKSGSSAEIQEGYGLSETASVVTVGRTGKVKPLSQGSALDGNEIKIYNGEKICNPYELGEIYVSTPSLMNGYLDDLTPSNIVYMDGKRYLKTGDLGYLDEEGLLFYKERIKRTIKIGAINIFPQEIERVVRELDEVQECCAARKYDENKKPYVCLYLQVADEACYNAQLIAKIKKKIEHEIVRYAIPRQFCLESEIKRTNMGKIDYSFYEQKID